MLMDKVVIISGYFNPLHIGHIQYIQGAKALGDKLLVIVNNDEQQLLKKGKIIMEESDRCNIVAALRDVDNVVLSIDSDPTVCETISYIARNLKDTNQLIFANGGDRDSSKEVPETFVCRKYGIEMVFDAGGIDKIESSSNINKRTGDE
jgi:glycerol-3-phosphate cytidylyltransferase/D-beta-D-heptose 7-phosphate kinase/D-beta-D-heptose 1-phosphate adenosyltransferase